MFAHLRSSEDTCMAVEECLMQRDYGFHSKSVRELLEDFDKGVYSSIIHNSQSVKTT